MFHQLKNEPEIRKRISSRLITTQQHMDGVKIMRNQSTSISTPNNMLPNVSPLQLNSNKDRTNNDNNNSNDIIIEQLKKLVFVDLGSGDGRLVFRAAREDIFDECIGYEINPILHSIALIQRLFGGPKYWNTRTKFYIRNIWDVNLHNADVVAVVSIVFF